MPTEANRTSKTKKATSKTSKVASKKIKPAESPAAREKQMINLAVNLAEKQLREGTASASTINHYLKLGSEREHIERELLENQALVAKAKADDLQSGKKYKEGYGDVIDKLSLYQGKDDA